MITNLLISCAVLAAPAPNQDLAVQVDAPSTFVAGTSYEVTVTVAAGANASSPMAAWLLTPGAFSIGGEPLEARDESKFISLPAGAELTLSYDLAPHISTEGNFELTFADGLAGDPIQVTQYEPVIAAGEANAPDFMSMAPEQLADHLVLMQTNRGDMLMEFWPDVAPDHVRNFLDLSHTGFYEGVIFHRVIPGFMIQGGDPTGSGSGNGPRTLKAEFNSRRHERGVLSMARTNDPNSASCQFFVMHADSPHLDNQYSAFGKLVSGIEVVDAIATTPRGRGDRPNTPQTIQRAIVLKRPSGE